MFINHLNTMDVPLSNQSSLGDTIDSLVIFDRKIDLMSPLLTQLTYEGLVDEAIGITNSHVEVPSSLLAPPQNPPPATSSATAAANTTPTDKPKKHQLSTASDPLLAQLRDLNFSSIARQLSKTAHRLAEAKVRRTLLHMCSRQTFAYFSRLA